MTLPAVVPPLAIYAGDSFEAEYRFLDEDLQPVDMGGWELTARLKSRQRGFVFDFVVDATDAADGYVRLTLTPAATNRLVGDGNFDLQGVDGEVVRTFFVGTYRAVSDVTI